MDVYKVIFLNKNIYIRLFHRKIFTFYFVKSCTTSFSHLNIFATMNNFDRIKSREHFNLVIGQVFERGIRIKYTCTINQHSNKQNNVLKVIEIIFDRCLVVSLTFLALIYPLKR